MHLSTGRMNREPFSYPKRPRLEGMTTALFHGPRGLAALPQLATAA